MQGKTEDMQDQCPLKASMGLGSVVEKTPNLITYRWSLSHHTRGKLLHIVYGVCTE